MELMVVFTTLAGLHTPLLLGIAIASWRSLASPRPQAEMPGDDIAVFPPVKKNVRRDIEIAFPGSIHCCVPVDDPFLFPSPPRQAQRHQGRQPEQVADGEAETHGNHWFGLAGGSE
jgi:hypothetical protein